MSEEERRLYSALQVVPGLLMWGELLLWPVIWVMLPLNQGWLQWLGSAQPLLFSPGHDLDLSLYECLLYCQAAS